MKNAFAEINKLIENQFRYGGEKYKSTATKEATDELFDAHGYRGLMFTIDKYTYRFKNLARERDLLKISAYMYILWLKRGYHLNQEGTNLPIDTTVEVKAKFFSDFILTVYSHYEDSKFYFETIEEVAAREKISNMIKEFSATSWLDISSDKLCHIYCLAFAVWHLKYYQTGEAGRDTDTNNEEKIFTEKLTKAAKDFFNGANLVDELDIEILVKAQVKLLLKKD